MIHHPQQVGRGRRKRPPAYLSQELVVEILSRLPVKSLLRFRSVCKAWRSIISDDDSSSLVLAHLRHQPPSLLIIPFLEDEDDGTDYCDMDDVEAPSSSIGLYRWTPYEGMDDVEAPRSSSMDAARLVHNADMPRPDVVAHCDGLVLLVTTAARQRQQVCLLFNPAARQAPFAPPAMALAPGAMGHQHHHQAFGLGRDPRGSGAYKVARFFYREVYVVATARFALATGMEVFTVDGASADWRETAAQPLYPAVPGRTATFHQASASLLWTIDHRYLAAAPVPGFLRFSLQDETFAVTPAPPPLPCSSSSSSLSELRGQLCVTVFREEEDPPVLDLWMAQDAVHPQWEQRYTIHVTNNASVPRPLDLFDDGTVLFHEVGWNYGDAFLSAYHPQTRELKNVVHLYKLNYHGTAFTSQCRRRRPRFSNFFVTPYRESLVRIKYQ